MIQSLLIKLAMLAAVVALVFWIGWPTPDESGREDEEEPTLAPVARMMSAPDRPTGQRTSQLAEPALKDGGTTGPAAKLDVNKATAGELERLPGIGSVLAKRIVEWRRDRGAFASVDDLNHVKGIGEKKLRQIKPLVTVSRPRPPVPARPAADQGKGPEAR